ncbi:MAG: DinB family protein [Candidatus Acidiferrales bacterium]
MKYVLTSLALASMSVGACIASGLAQTTAPPAAAQTAAPVKDPVTASLRMLLPRARTNILGAITAMPADKFNYKPTPEQMTFAHLVVHIIGSNNGGCAKSADVAAPKMEEVKETDSKDKLLAAASASFDFCGDALTKMDDSKLGDSLELFGGRQGPRALVALGLASGWADHYAAAAMYLRLNGILPPTAQPKK